MILVIDKNIRVPIYIQIKEEIKKLIMQGKLKPHEKLPPTRELANSLNVSRNTVLQSYSLLEAEGFIYSLIGKGTFVNPTVFNKEINNINIKKQKTSFFDNLLSFSWKRYETSLMSGIDQIKKYEENTNYITFDSPKPDMEYLPIENFKHSLISSIKKYSFKLFSSIETEGFYPFREYITKYLVRRGIYSDTENILITSGIQQGLSLIGKLFIDPGDIVVLENLTYPGALSVFRSTQAHCIGIPTDDDGIAIDILEKVLKHRKVKLLYTIPTYHNPLGTVLSFERKKALLNLSEKYGFMIIEDDYAHELCFSGKEEIPIKALDTINSVLYMGSFSESIFPGIRLSWIVTPKAIAKKLSYLKASSDLYTNPILQAAVLDFMENGYFEKHLKKLNKILSKRNEVINYALTRYLPKSVKWNNIKGGPYRWINLPPNIDSIDLLLKTREKGVLFAPDRIFAAEDWGKSGFRLKFSNVNENNIWKGIKIISETLIPRI